MNIVELEQAAKHYQGVHALKGLNLELKQGEILGLFGHNGAGKTTAIKLILGLIEASKGQVRVFGENPRNAGAKNQRRQLGFLQENVSFYDQMTGLEVLNYFARLKGVDKGQSLALLEQMGLSHAMKRRVKTYSKGMRQRLGLAQALLGEPKLLLLDEPTVGLDPIASHDFYQRLEQLKQGGCSIILCSHVLPGVEKYIDRAMVMGQGALLAEGNLKQLRSQANLPATLHLEGDIVLPADLKSMCVDGAADTLAVSLEDKMPVLQRVLALPGLDNFELHLPSLEDLYTHFSANLHLEAERV